MFLADVHVYIPFRERNLLKRVWSEIDYKCFWHIGSYHLSFIFASRWYQPWKQAIQLKIIRIFSSKASFERKTCHLESQFGFLLIQTQSIDHYKNLYLNKCTRLFFLLSLFFQRIMTQAYFLQPEPSSSSSSIEGFEFRVPFLNEVDQFSTCQSFFNANPLPSCKPLNV